MKMSLFSRLNYIPISRQFINSQRDCVLKESQEDTRKRRREKAVCEKIKSILKVEEKDHRPRSDDKSVCRS